VKKEYAAHETVNHSIEEYVRYDHTFDENNKLHTKVITTNTVKATTQFSNAV